MRRLFLLLVLLALPSIADVESTKTGGLVNGRFWHDLQPMAKIAFLIGFEEGIGEEATRANEQHGTVKVYFEAAANYGEIIAGVDRLYEQPENALVPVIYILEVFTMKVRGATPTEIGDKLANYRKVAIQIQQAPKQKDKQKF